jgi:hypothetical protein
LACSFFLPGVVAFYVNGTVAQRIVTGVKEWSKCEQYQPGQKNVRNEPLVHKRKPFLPPLHINLDMMKNFVKAVDGDGKVFQYLLPKFL